MNPADTHAPRVIDGKLPVCGITRVTRHPRLCGVSLWATAHLLVNGHLTALFMFGALLVAALNGMVSIDRKRRRALGELWDEFESQTSRLPFAAILTGRNRFEFAEFYIWQVALAVALFSGVFWLHGIMGHRHSGPYGPNRTQQCRRLGCLATGSPRGLARRRDRVEACRQLR